MTFTGSGPVNVLLRRFPFFMLVYSAGDNQGGTAISFVPVSDRGDFCFFFLTCRIDIGGC